MARLWWTDFAKFGRTCLDCRTYQFDETTGKKTPDRTKAREGLPMLRVKSVDPPCHDCSKTVGLTVRHWLGATDPPGWAYRAFKHYRTCKAVRWHVPAATDPIVQRNAALFDGLWDVIEQGRSAGVLEILSLVGAGGRG